MNLGRLKTAEASFLDTYPGGFAHPEMVKIGKKHRMDPIVEFTQQAFKPGAFRNREQAREDVVKVLGRSSMVSVFEKAKARDALRAMDDDSAAKLLRGLKARLHGDEKKGFETMKLAMEEVAMAKWTLMSAIPLYFKPHDEVFVKPTTAKGVIEHFELNIPPYKPKPTWEFYEAFREAVLHMRDQVDASLSPNNAAFTGFLMHALNGPC